MLQYILIQLARVLFLNLHNIYRFYASTFDCIASRFKSSSIIFEVQGSGTQSPAKCILQRWSPRGRPWPRGQILKSLAVASKIKFLASRPQVLENWPVLGSRTALFFELLKFCGAFEKFFGKRFFCEDRLKNFCEDLFFFGEHLRLCPWSLALASSISVLGLESVCPRKGCPWPRIFFVSLALGSSLVSSTPPLVF